MNKIKQTSNKLKVVICRLVNLVWIIAIATLGLFLIDIIQLPEYILKAYSIGLLLTAAWLLYKSSK